MSLIPSIVKPLIVFYVSLLGVSPIITWLVTIMLLRYDSFYFMYSFMLMMLI